MRRFVLLVLLALGCIEHSAAQKAFEVIRYRGKIGKYRAEFQLADGHLPGSQLFLYHGKKSIQFLPASGEPESKASWKFIPRRDNAVIKAIIIGGISGDGEVPEKVTARVGPKTSDHYFLFKKK